MLPLLKSAIAHKDFPAPLRLQTACSGTDAPAIALQMFSEMFEEMDTQFDVDHVMSCEIDPFKQAYIARNFDGVKLFADVNDLASESGSAPTAFGGLEKIPHGDLLVAGTVCKDFSGLRTNNKKRPPREQRSKWETFCAVVEFMYKHKLMTYIRKRSKCSMGSNAAICRRKIAIVGYIRRGENREEDLK